MIPAALRYARPESLAEALELLQVPGARALAGGQSLINVLKLRAAQVEVLVDISALEELRFIRATDDGGLEIGACVTYEDLATDEAIRRHHPRIAEIAAGTVDQQVRCRGTLGGNCCYADPCSNFPPLMLALGAGMRIATPSGARDVPAEEFVRGFCSTAVGAGELLHSVILPPLGAGTGVGYSSLQIAKDSWALARAATVVQANGTVDEARVVLGCVAPTPLRQPEVESRLAGRGADDAGGIEQAAEAACEGFEPISDVHASGEYRRRMSKLMTRRAIVEAIADAAARRESA